MSSNIQSRTIVPGEEHVLFDISRKEKELEQELEEAKKKAGQIAEEARVEAGEVVKKAKEGRIEKEIGIMKARIEKENALEETAGQGAGGVLKISGDKQEEAVRFVLSQILPRSK